MNEQAGRVFSVAADNPPIPGCTISSLVHDAGELTISHFSLAANTSISAETYSYPKLWLVADGEADVFTSAGHHRFLHKGDGFVTPQGIPVGIRTQFGCIHTEITLRKESPMNECLHADEVFALKNLLPYEDGKIINMDLINDEKLKFVIMSFGAGTGLTEHAAPGEAMIFALDGKGIIGYEGKEHPIQAGENFQFAKGGAHWVKADGPFKLALLLTLE